MTVSAHARRTPLRPPSPPVCHRSITEMEGDNNNNNSGSCSSAAANGNGNGNGGSGSPCGACKFLRRKCVRGCVFAPFFNGDEGAGEFAAVHKVFGASNVAKLLSSIPSLCLRRDAVVCVCFEAQWRLRDPVYGCVSHIVALQHQVERLQNELAALYSQVASRRLQPSSHLEQTVSPTNYSNGINASHMSFAMPNNGALVGCCIMQKEGNIGDRPDYSYNSNYSCETAYDASSSSSSSMARLYANSFQQSTSDEQQQEYLQRVAHALLGRAA